MFCSNAEFCFMLVKATIKEVPSKIAIRFGIIIFLFSDLTIDITAHTKISKLTAIIDPQYPL